MATGYSKENTEEFPGSEHVTQYGQISVDPEDFEGKSVLILGMMISILYSVALLSCSMILYSLMGSGLSDQYTLGMGRLLTRCLSGGFSCWLASSAEL